MKKKILCIFIIILTILAGCAKEEKSNIEVSDDEVGIETMEGMNYLVAGNDYGFYFDVYSKSGDKKNNELQNFRFEGAYIAETCAVNGIFEMILDNVTILPQNSCNRDIREMRANELKLKIREPEITAFVEEGYKVYDADGNLKEKKEDILIAAEDQAAKLKELEQKKKELENRISFALQTGKFEEAGKYCDDLEQIINQM